MTLRNGGARAVRQGIALEEVRPGDRDRQVHRLGRASQGGPKLGGGPERIHERASQQHDGAAIATKVGVPKGAAGVIDEVVRHR